MKRVNNIWIKVIELHNLKIAFYKASRGKSHLEEVQKWIVDLDVKLQSLQQLLLTEKLQVGNYTYFKIYDPKKRSICAASFTERVVHHALMNICDPFFEKQQIFHSYATRRNKGTHKALQKCLVYNQDNVWFCKLDVKKFFDTINHTILKQLLSNKFKEKHLLNLLFKIIDSYQVKKNQGVPIGNLTSQYFANFYLSFLDRYAKQVLRIKSYIRYMDDIVFWAENKKQLWYNFKKIEFFLQKNMRQNFKPIIFNKTEKNSFMYLGFMIGKNKILPNRRNSKRYNDAKTALSLYDNPRLKQQFWCRYQHIFYFKHTLTYL